MAEQGFRSNNNKIKFIKTKKRQEVVESYDRLHPEEKRHIAQEKESNL